MISVLTRPEHVHEVFKDSDRHIKAVDNNSGYIFSQLLGKCVGLISQNEWKTVRGISEQAFLRTSAATHLTIIKRRVQRHFDELSQQPAYKQGLLDPALDLKMLPFWIIAEVLYGPLSPEVEEDLAVLAEQREALFRHAIRGGLSRFGWTRFIFRSAAHRELDRFQERWAQFNDDAYRRALLRHEERLPIVAMTVAVAAGRMTRAHLLHTLDEILFANLDVTLGGISWNVVFLAAHPDCQTRLRCEIAERAVQPPPPPQENGPGKAPTATAANPDEYYRTSSSYLAACIAESARLRPLASFSVPQAAPTARVVGGFLFPAGTNFIIDSYALNQRSPFWAAGAGTAAGMSPQKYHPERFAGLNPTQARYQYWRFGFGPRQCMGKYAADLILRVLLVHVVANYELALDEKGEELWRRDPDNWINHPQMHIRIWPLGAGEGVGM
jgi:cytochrome P450